METLKDAYIYAHSKQTIFCVVICTNLSRTRELLQAIYKHSTLHKSGLLCIFISDTRYKISHTNTTIITRETLTRLTHINAIRLVSRNRWLHSYQLKSKLHPNYIHKLLHLIKCHLD